MVGSNGRKHVYNEFFSTTPEFMPMKWLLEAGIGFQRNQPCDLIRGLELSAPPPDLWERVWGLGGANNLINHAYVMEPS